MGHRNQQGIAIDDKGDIYVAEHGPQGGDELNRIIEGKNYGWPKESLGITYNNEKLPESNTFGRHDTFEAPVFAWMPSVAVSSMVYIKPGFHDAWTGDFLVGAFSKTLHRIRFANGRPIYSESIQIGSRIRAMHQHTGGQIVLWTDNRELIWLKAENRESDAVAIAEFIASQKFDRAFSHKFEMAITKCAECHSFDVGDSARSPSLARIYGDPIASTGYGSYSQGLSAKSGQWTSENLTAFIGNPQAFAPGTVMPQVADDPEVVAAVVEYLRRYDRRF
jgi:cytochrome c2